MASGRHRSAATPRYSERDIARLRLFLGTLSIVCVMFATAFAVLAIFYLSKRLTIGSLFLFGTFAIFAHAFNAAKQGAFERAALVVGYALFAVIITFSLLMPWAIGTMRVLCLMLIGVELAYLKGEHLARMMALSLISLAVATLSSYLAPDTEGLPEILVIIMNVGGGSFAALLVLLLLWQYSERLHETLAEQHAAETRARFLSQVGNLLLQSLDSPALAMRVAQLIVPEMADWFTLSMTDGVKLERLVCLHRDPDRKAAADAYLRLPGRLTSSIAELDRSLRTRGTTLIDPIDEAWLRNFARSPEELSLLKELGIASAIVAPLNIAGQMRGVISFARSDPDDHYDESEVEVAAEVAARLSLALDNARLLESERTAVQVRDDFLSIAGHELKTPLTAALLQVQSLQRLVQKGAPALPQLGERIDKARENVERLARLTNELLDVSRVSAGRLHLEPERCDLSELARDVAERFTAAAAKAKSELCVDASIPIAGVWDRTRIEQVLTNLIANAIKFGAGKPVEVTTRVDGERAKLSVRDHGIGIAPEQVQRIFERFERGVTEREFSGLGLGLWITEQIVEASGGEISVASTVGQGSTFTVALPLLVDAKLDEV